MADIPLVFSSSVISRLRRLCFLFGLLIISLAGCETETPSDRPSVSFRYAEAESSTDWVQVQPSLYQSRLSKQKPVKSETNFRRRTDCGIDFKNYVVKRPLSLYIETGSGVAIADYDNDGLDDIYLTGSSIANKLFKNMGNFEFKDVTDVAGVSGRVSDQLVDACGASFADIDNDGDLDLYVCNMAAPNLLYVNQGDGTFIEEAAKRKCNYFGGSKQAAFCDFDHDGDLDFYLVTYQDTIPNSSDNSVIEIVDGKESVVAGKEEYVQIIEGHQTRAGERDLLYENVGDGVFSNVSDKAGIQGFDLGLGGVWFDYNQDGWSDFYVGSDYLQPDHLYRNNHDGTFTDVIADTVTRTTWSSMGVDSADLNNDGLPDLIVADMADQTHYGQKMNMGEMASSSWFLVYGQPRQFTKNCVFLNAGNERFLESATMSGLAKSDWTWGIRLADLDCDGLLDVYMANGHVKDQLNSDWIIQRDKLESTPDIDPVELQNFYDSVPRRKETNMAFRNKGDVTFESVASQWGLDHNGISHSCALADLDGDGDLDMVVNNYFENPLVYENCTDGTASVIVELQCGSADRFGVGAKIEIWQDGTYQQRYLNPSRGYLSSDPLKVHFGVEPDAAIEKMKVSFPGRGVQEYGDLEPGNRYLVVEDSTKALPTASADDRSTIFKDVTETQQVDFQHVEAPFDDYQREPLLPYQLSRLGGAVAAGDINGDTYPDFYVSGAARESGKLFVNQAGQKFSSVPGPWEGDSPCEDMGAVFFDADGDGDQDLYVVSGGNESDAQSELLQDRLYLNDGAGKFSTASAGTLPNLRDSGSCVAVADCDRDGDLDLFVGSRYVSGKYPVTPSSRILINEKGKFTEASFEGYSDLANVGLVSSAVWSDYNKDGWIDLIIALDWGPVTIFQNGPSGMKNVTAEQGLDKHTGWWNGIAAGDLDADGDIDFVVTNQGLNTKYHADANHPQRLYYHDFDNNGTLDLVESEFEGDTEFPVRGRSCSSKCMPFISEKFTTFHDFSLASIADIYETKKTTPQRREVNFLASAVLWNDGGAGFEIEALPVLAQISPAYGVVVNDFDKDGNMDILFGNNFFGSQPETSYLDGGLSWLIKGLGDHQFSCVWPNRSGINNPGDTNGLAMADIDRDGDQDAVFLENNGPVRIYENLIPTSPTTVVRLEGPKGNSSCVGCRADLIFENNTRVVEYRAGGGYLSQSFVSGVVLSAEESKKLKSVVVTWPDGTSATKEITDTAEEIFIKYVGQH